MITRDQYNHWYGVTIGDNLMRICVDRADTEQIPIDNLALLLNEHCHVHEHLVQLLDWRLQLHEHLVSEEQGLCEL